MAEQAATRDVEQIANTWIDMSDGCRLAARLWLPVDADDDPVPALLECTPYRKGDLHSAVDARIAPWFAARGYAYVRVDIRGSGDSEGELPDEYLPQEQDDGLDVLAWLGKQPWCTGAVGMMGSSWGGFNGLQLAARRPPELKAVISMYSSDDRYADDVHYMGGTPLVQNLVRASSVLARNALPPNPETAGDSWREAWFERLDQTSPSIDAWMAHQRRDDYWQQGSICEDYDAIECPVYMVGGWADGSVNAVLRFVESAPGMRKGLIGPWARRWPQDGTPGPAIGFLQECLRWWDRWLKDEPNGIDEEPRVHAFIQEPYRSERSNQPRSGRWVAEETWPSPNVATEIWRLGDGVLDPEQQPAAVLTHFPSLRHGALAGAWCPHGYDPDYPADQREEDALCLTFTSEPLSERIELLGRPRVRLAFSVDQPIALVAARLCDVHPDGRSTLITRGALNLTHLDTDEEPTELEPGHGYVAEIDLNVLGQAIEPGHRLRLALSTTYWPWLWPSPAPVELVVFTKESSVELPVRARLDEEETPSFEPPEEAPGPNREVLEEHPPFRTVHRDPSWGMLAMEVCAHGFLHARDSDTGDEVVWDDRDLLTITEGRPLSATVRCERRFDVGRDDWHARIQTVSTMTADANAFRVVDELEAFEGDERVFTRRWDRTFPRDHT